METPAPNTISADTTLEGITSGPITVRDGGTLTISGTHEGPVVLEGGSVLLVRGVLNGTVDVASLATATVFGDLVGRVHIRVAGTLIVEAEGRLAGPVVNYGSFTNRGLRSGPVEGRDPDDQDDAVTVAPLHPGGSYSYALTERN